MRIGPFSVPVSPCYVLDLFYNAIAPNRLFGQYAQQAAALLVFLSRGAPMEDPRDSLNFQIGWFKATASGRFTIVAVLTFLLVLAVSTLMIWPKQIESVLPKQVSYQQ